MTAPPTPSLALVIEALREFGIKCASELNVTGTVLRFADEKAESAARALLQKLSDHGVATFHCVCTLDAEGNLEPCKTHAQWAKSIAPPDAVASIIAEMRASMLHRAEPDIQSWADRLEALAPPDAIRAEPVVYGRGTTPTSGGYVEQAVYNPTPPSGAAEPAAWKEAIDHELVISLNTCTDAYTDPRKAISDLIAWHIAVATDERVNGGKRLVDIASLRRAFGFDDSK